MAVDRSDECQAAMADALKALLSQAEAQGWVRAEVLLAISDFSRHELVMLVKEDVLGVQRNTR
ncbi:hypothetical protein CPY51_06220 [Rhizobium tubonense]|uniref:Uncharacterized protein n=2 Tax=Rhizobium tubonense TaxID=484088 RepID=A0A2W4F033_9HYPH|nr:hypothetical protein CPY51_06220 [Rhizobium tubonense]